MKNKKRKLSIFTQQTTDGKLSAIYSVKITFDFSINTQANK